jgi:hypothetical protein
LVNENFILRIEESVILKGELISDFCKLVKLFFMRIAVDTILVVGFGLLKVKQKHRSFILFPCQLRV